MTSKAHLLDLEIPTTEEDIRALRRSRIPRESDFASKLDALTRFSREWSFRPDRKILAGHSPFEL